MKNFTMVRRKTAYRWWYWRIGRSCYGLIPERLPIQMKGYYATKKKNVFRLYCDFKNCRSYQMIIKRSHIEKSQLMATIMTSSFEIYHFTGGKTRGKRNETGESVNCESNTVFVYSGYYLWIVQSIFLFHLNWRNNPPKFFNAVDEIF